MSQDQRVAEIFKAAIALTPGEREAFLTAECGGDARLQADIVALLRADQAAASFLDPPARQKPTSPAAGVSMIGRQIGQYHIERLIGSGGMGSVFEATQERPRRTVALKIMLTALVSPNSLRRFEYESQVLAHLRHPGIAQVYEVGSYLPDEARPGDVLPYFAMEFIPSATTLLEYSNRRQLLLRDRLELFARVCDAVHYGHQQGIIHRDLKPDNILMDASGRPKVIDFGVARATDADLHTTTHATGVGQLVGTLRYMSPEQSEADPHGIDTRSDVYALGVVLYELLAGRHPYELATLTLSEMLRVIREVAPKSMSAIHRALHGDVETIVLKALEKSRDRRYQTAAEFALDIRHFLSNEPISARPPSASYQLRKFSQRHKALVVGFATTLLALLVGFVGIVLGLNRAVSAEYVATQALHNVRRLSDIKRLTDLEHAQEDLWPARPARTVDLKRWLATAKDVVTHLEDHRNTLRALRSQDESSPGETLQFTSFEDGWQYAMTLDLVTNLEALADPGKKGGIADVERRLHVATTIQKNTIADHQGEWEDAMADIAEGSRYGGLEIHSQIGLVPLGADPESGLEEFWVYESGDRPERDPTTKRWKITGETGLVLVLIPGGTFLMGGQNSDSGAANYDPGLLSNEMPVHEVTLKPFFLSKYEMTQGQWRRVTDSNPGYWKHHGERDAGAHPVEQVSHRDCVDVLTRLGLVLPTEAQWEYGARAATMTPWWTGNAKASLNQTANLADQSYRRAFRDVTTFELWDDGYVDHAPVGMFRANGFGLHDTAGNVWEWCRDWYGPYTQPVHPGDGERVVLESDDSSRVNRSGSFYDPAFSARSAYRLIATPEYRATNLGCRPAAVLEP